MKSGYLSQYFTSVAAKKLSAVEVDFTRSHQHEFNGSNELKTVLGRDEPKEFQTTFLWIEEQNAALSEIGWVKWYDARANHPTRSEYRLYYPSNAILNLASEGDTLFIARRTDDTLLMVVTVAGSTIERQLYWLFGLNEPVGNLFSSSEIENNNHEIDFTTRFILEELNIEVEEPENDLLDTLIKPFNNVFPTTSAFSYYARKTLTEKVDFIDDPDGALITLMGWEEKLFRRLERHIVELRLNQGFSNKDGQDVDGFISFSLSVQNRRKSRAGSAFEDHIGHIFKKNSLLFDTRIQTELKSKPNFLFPNLESYSSDSFPVELLSVLGAKTSLKDRWRQVATEAKKIKTKHILTLEPGISENQTNEMIGNNIQLVLPKSIHQTFNTKQKSWLWDLKYFISYIKDKQNTSISNGYLII